MLFNIKYRIINIIHSSLLLGLLKSVVDQCIVSISNFVTCIIIVKSLLPAYYGIFTLFYTGLFVLSGFQSALITGPMRVYGIAVKNEADYFGVQTQLQIALGLLINIITWITLYALKSYNVSTLIFFVLCSFLFQLQELTRIIDLTKLHLNKLLLNDVATHSVRLVSLIALSHYNILTVNTSIIAIAISYLIGYIIRYDHNVCHFNVNALTLTMLQNWKYGKWLLMETLVYSLSTQIYIYITAIMVNKESAGALNAIQNLMSPVTVITLGVMSYVIPVARKKLLDTGYKEWHNYMVKTGSILMIFVVLVMSIMSVFSTPIIRLVYSEYYVKYSLLIPILSIAYVLMCLNSLFSTAYKTVNMPQVGFYMKTISALFTIIASYPLLKHEQIYGSAIGLIMTQLIWAIVSFVLIMKGYMSSKYIESYDYKS